MTCSFVAYIDESGDEGFTFHADGTGSSRWFVLTAVVFRAGVDIQAVHALQSARSTLRWDRHKPFHFSDMKHDQRLLLLTEAAKVAFRTVSVVSHKPDIVDVETYQANKCMLYRYLTRLLIERVSWLCRDNRRTDEGDGTVDLVFSDRAMMSYDDMRSYIDLLHKQSAAGADVQIHWPTIEVKNIRAVAHTKLAGLQVADAAATSLFYALRLGRYGVADPSYLQHLRKHAYRHRKRWLGYGVKFLSDFSSLKERMPHVGAAFKDW